jgi:hypothetical protein
MTSLTPCGASLAAAAVETSVWKSPPWPALRCTPAEWTAFTAGVRDGEFD